MELNKAVHKEPCDMPGIKEEHFHQDQITTETQTSHAQEIEKHFVECVQSNDVDTKVRILDETWDPNVASSDLKFNPKQPSTCLGTGMKVIDEIGFKEEDVNFDEVSPESQKLHLQQSKTYFMEYNVSCDLDSKAGIKQQAWDPNGVSSEVKCDPEQPPTLDTVPFIGPGTIKDDEIDAKEDLWGCEETSAESPKDREGSGQKKIQAAEDVPLLELSRPFADPVYSSSATQLQENKNTCSLSAKPNISVENCEKNHRYCDKNCTFTAVSRDHLIQNLRRQYVCNTCGKSFLKMRYLKVHLLLHDDLKLYMCQICGKSFKQVRVLKKHLLVHDDKRLYKCQICEKRFKELPGLKSHLLVHEDKRQYKCHICEKSFKQLSGLKSHVLIHEDKRQYKCQICGKSFNQLGGLKSHLLAHEDKRQYKCHICEKSFNRLGGLKSHLLVHEDKRDYKCQICEKSFKQLGGLKSHLLVHEDKRQYKCQICEKSFKQLAVLKSHFLAHEDIRQYKCQICEKSFKYISGLKSHLLVHDDKRRYKCQTCDKSFKKLPGLKLHLFAHADKSQFKCEICAKSYKWLRSLKRHILIHSEKSYTRANLTQKD